jgi:hypothetical protein
MVNVFSPNGFKQYRHLEGNQPTMGFETFRINSSDASVIYTGDPVVTGLAAGAAAGTFYGRYVTGSSQVTSSGSSMATMGIFLGCKYYNPSVNRMVWSAYWPGNQSAGGPDVEAYICTDAQMLYLVQSSTATLITSSMIGYGIPYNNTTSSAFASAASGQSGVSAVSSLASATTVSTGGYPFPFTIFDFAGPYSGGAGSPSWDINPAAGALSGFVNGMDPTSAGMFLIVKPNNFLFSGGAVVSSIGTVNQ